MRKRRWVMGLATLGMVGVVAGLVWRLTPSSAAALEKLGTEVLPGVPLTEQQKTDLAALLDGTGNIGLYPGFYDEKHYVPMSPVAKSHMSGIYPGRASYESWHILHSSRVRLLLSLGLQDRKAIGELMKKMLQSALASWPEASEEEWAMWKSGEMGRGLTKATPVARVRAQAEVAIYVLGEMRYHEGLKALYEGQCTQQEWIDALPEEKATVFVPACPVPPPMILFALHRLISAYPEAGLGEKSLAALRAYRTWAQVQVPASDTYHVVYEAPATAAAGAEKRPAFPAYQVEYVHEWPVVFRDGTEMQKYAAAPYVTDRSKKWFGLMGAFVESLP